MHVVELGARHEVPVHRELGKVVRGRQYVVELDAAVQILRSSWWRQRFPCLPAVQVAVQDVEGVDHPPDADAVHLHASSPLRRLLDAAGVVQRCARGGWVCANLGGKRPEAQEEGVHRLPDAGAQGD